MVLPGISAEEIGATQGLSMAVCAGRVNALMKEISRRNS